MRKLYALLTRHCNLKCPHCDIFTDLTYNEEYNEKQVIHQIKTFDGSVILFGGEPTLYKDRLYAALSTGNVSSISTNLLLMDEDILEIYRKLKSVATSWNPKRFSNTQYDLWKSNLKNLHFNNIRALILITITKDLIEIGAENFMAIVRSWSQDIKSINRINFEIVVDSSNTPEFHNNVDDWLCELYKIWDVPIQNQIFENLKNGFWDYECSKTFTMYPNGEIVTGCPHRTQLYMPTQCYTCDLIERCRPCQLQQHCSRPIKLTHLINKK